MNLIHTVVFLSVFNLCSCKTRRIKNPNKDPFSMSNSLNQDLLQEQVVTPIASIPERSPAEPKDLRPGDVELQSKDGESGQTLSFGLNGDTEADYLEFAICEDTTTGRCHPDRTMPLRFAKGAHEFPAPPPGPKIVHVRACVAPSRAPIFDRPCGQWTTIRYLQAAIRDKELQDILSAQYFKELEILAECEKVAKVLNDYRVKNPKPNSDFDILLDNYRNHILPVTCKELILSNDWVQLEAGIIKEPGHSEQKEQAGGSVLLALGLPMVITGSAVMGLGLSVQSRFNKSIAKHWTHYINAYSGSEVDYRYYDTKEQIRSRKNVIDNYLEAIDRKLTFTKQQDKSNDLIRQKKILVQEQEFLEKYIKIEKPFFQKEANIANQSDSEIKALRQQILEKIETKDLKSSYHFLAEIEKIDQVIKKKNLEQSIPTKISRSTLFTEVSFKKPSIGQRSLHDKQVVKNFVRAGALSAVLGAVMVGVEAFSLNASTMRDIATVNSQLQLIYQKIKELRKQTNASSASEIKKSKSQTDLN